MALSQQDTTQLTAYLNYMALQYCTRCVMPNTRPGLTFNGEGVCSACVGAEEKINDIKWNFREQELRAIFNTFKGKAEWDCIVPVSGGKDSIYQVHVVKNQYNLKPLCLTFRTEARTPLGEHNIEALRKMGVDHLDLTPNSNVFSKLRLKTFVEVGDCSLPDHLAIWNIIPNISLKFKVPLVVWGENPDMEYGGTTALRHVARLNIDWMKSQHILKGKTLRDWCGEDINFKELNLLQSPNEKALDSMNYTPIFLGYYLPWDAQHNFVIALGYGFEPRKSPIMGLYSYADIDCMYIVIHHYFKWLKFGFNRVTDNACNEIRKGRLSRKKAIQLVEQSDGILPPREYIQHFCKTTGISEKHFWEIAEKFRNRDVWYKDSEGKFQLRGWIGGPSIPENWRHPFE